MTIYRQPNDQVFPPIEYPKGLQLPLRSFARIVVRSPKAVKKVEEILRQMDEEEFDKYYPEGLVACDGLTTIYTGKYILNLLKLLNHTKDIGIACYVMLQEDSERYESY